MVRVLRKYRHRAAHAFRRFGRAREGATAVEFALIAPAFIALLVAIFQVCVYVFVQQTLQNAATQAGRLFLTGQAQGWSQTAFKNYVCNNYLPTMFSCSSLIVSVQTYQSFAAANTSAPALYDANGQAITNFPYSPGVQGQIMIVQLVYPWTVVSGPLGFAISNLPNGAAEMMGISAFRVEPY
jgi:Flp pilus assembly protein TadG